MKAFEACRGRVKNLRTESRAGPVASAAEAVLEVKYDAFLPDFVRDLVQLPNRRTAAFSKYAVCRRFG